MWYIYIETVDVVYLNRNCGVVTVDVVYLNRNCGCGIWKLWMWYI